MNVLLKNVTIVDAGSSHHLQVKDILIDNGIIQRIDSNISAENIEVLDCGAAFVSKGWIDIFSHFSDPGKEYRETLESGAAAAFSGGFTKVFTIANTQPVIDNKAQVSYIVEKSKSLPVQVFPLGAITQHAEGKDLSEMYDMHNSGAIAFSDGLNPVQSPGLFLKALQYVKAFDGILIQQPFDKSIGTYGLINEGIISTKLGLPGLPAIAEELMIARDIELLRYTESKLHVTGISTAKSVALIAKAKAEGLNITCSVAPYQLFFTDADLQSYNTNLKTNPPLRSKEDQIALKQAVLDATIDVITSHHFPLHSDEKDVEFEYAKNGMLGLQTSYNLVQESLPELSAERIVELFNTNPAKIFGLKNEKIEEGKTADLTVFQPTGVTIFTKENNKSKSQNSPLFNKELKGKVLATVAKNHFFINQ
ncbi:dihydroorotase [Arachidicoccus ginsenosidimutans]|uniref:dihydroorotase n=1 Tax=Arachidicoccus sp. BS20 TaxID=1850526 RepID=UPI0007F05992|nr:dihydroorotase [Arachidicoccus sp. BS20]ANI88607.1 dihydroorotase [Arachidicoccus sp. BS20]